MDDLKIETVPAVVDANFEQIKSQLTEELKSFDVVVTEDTLAESKKRATELNKLSGEIDTRRKEAVAKVSGPIKAFDSQAKELVAMCKEVRGKILQQVATFEAETLKAAETALIELLRSRYKEMGVREAFQEASVDALVKLGALTAKGNITSATEREVTSLARECFTKQQTIDLRLSQLEAASYKAGLSAPLSEEHVGGFLYDSDEAYEANLERLLARERDRQDEVLLRERERVERARELADRQPLPDEPAAESAPAADPEPAQQPEERAVEPSDDNRDRLRTVDVYVRLRVNVPERLSDERLIAQLMERLADAGVRDSVQSCTANQVLDDEAA